MRTHHRKLTRARLGAKRRRRKPGPLACIGEAQPSLQKLVGAPEFDVLALFRPIHAHYNGVLGDKRQPGIIHSADKRRGGKMLGASVNVPRIRDKVLLRHPNLAARAPGSGKNGMKLVGVHR